MEVIYDLGNLTLPTFGLLLLSITLGSFGQICLKMGLKEHGLQISGSFFHTIMNVIAAMMTPWVFLGLCVYVLSTFTWLLLISRVRLSVAYPMISMSYVIVMLLSVLILHETVHVMFAVAGLVCIGTGVSFIGLGMGQTKDDSNKPELEKPVSKAERAMK